MVWKSLWFGKATAAMEEDWKEWKSWDMWEEQDMTPNKWGWYGYNCKGKVRGSGTTHSNRKAAREWKQWSTLAATENPSSEACLEKHAEALKKAAEKAQEKLQEVREKKSLEKDETSESSSWSFQKKKARRKSKSPRASLEKDAAISSKDIPLKKGEELLRTRVAKNGQGEKLILVKQESLEKDSTAKGSTADQSLEKDQAAKEDKKPVETGPAAKEENKSSGKDTTEAQMSLEKDKNKGNKNSAPAGSLEKDSGGATLTPGPGAKPVVVVDWHNTIELNNKVPRSHQMAMQALLEVADVHIVSYVHTYTRHAAVLWDAKELWCHSQLAGVHTCWVQCGDDGKLGWCKYLNAVAIFDDCNDILVDCKRAGIEVYGITSKHSQHGNLSVKEVYANLPEAVQDFIDNL